MIYLLHLGRKPPIMRTTDFSTVKPGDIILTIALYNMQGNPLDSVRHCYTKHIVVSTNGADSIVMLNLNFIHESRPMLLTKGTEGFTYEPLDGNDAPKYYPAETILYFTEDEFINNRIDERITAQTKLVSLMSAWYSSEAEFPEEVTKAMQKALAEKASANLSNMNMGDLDSAYKVMSEVIAAGEKVYRDTIEANLSGMDELIMYAQEANEQVSRVVRTLNPWRNDGEATTITTTHAQGSYRTFDRHSTFRVGTGVMTDSGDAYFIDRLTKSRAYVINPKTGEKAGYLTRKKEAGVVLKLNNGEEVTLRQTYTVIPASTPEDLLAYKTAYRKVLPILETLYDHIKAARPKLTGFNLDVPSPYDVQTIMDAQVLTMRVTANLKREKTQALEDMESTISKMKRLHQLAYGN